MIWVLITLLYIAIGGFLTGLFGAKKLVEVESNYSAFPFILFWPVWIVLIFVISLALWCVDSGMLIFGERDE